jgi:tripartite-type tricarboxylate transporter receptor subunit TctC
VPNVVTARFELPANSVRELIAYARANPGKVTYASQGNGSTSHLSASMLQSMAGLELVHVPYKGEGPALIDIVAGRVDIFIGNLAAALKFHQSSRAKILAVASTRRSPVLPDVPTVIEAGLPGFVTSAWFGLVAPPGHAWPRSWRRSTPTPWRRSGCPDVRARFLEQGAEPVANTPAEMAAFVREEMARWQNVIQSANVTLSN